MSSTSEHPIEPLSAARWQRIEQGLFARLDAQAEPARRSQVAVWKWAGLSVAACLPLLAAGWLLLGRGDAAVAPAHFAASASVRELKLGDVAVRIEPFGELSALPGAGRALSVVLERGAARFAVPKRAAREALIVLAGDVRVEVVGTEFRVARVAGSAEVEMYEGTVRVVQAGRSVFVTRGQRWPEPAAVEPPAALATPAAPITAPHQPSAAPAEAQRRRYEQAAASEAKDPRQALRLYAGLARQSGPWAGNALYALGRLELELKDYDSAAQHLASYLERYPQGPNAVDARALLRRVQGPAP